MRDGGAEGEPQSGPGRQLKVAKANGMCKAKGGHGALINYFCPVTCKNRKLKSKDHKKDQNKIAEAVFGTTCKDLDKINLLSALDL